jgi:hypothetical protein
MARSHVENLHIDDVPRRTLCHGPLAGAGVRELSRDPVTGHCSWLVEIGPGFRSSELQGNAWDVYVLSGEIETAAGRLATGGYAYVPGNERSGVLTSDVGAELFVGIYTGQTREGDVAHVDPDDVPWDARVRKVPESMMGVSHSYVKFLRVDQHRNETIGLGAMTPGSGLDCSEEHEPVDEFLYLRGDILILDDQGRELEITPGVYQWREPFFRHLPKYSHTGNLNFFRIHGGAWSCPIDFKRCEDWEEIVRRYKEKWKDKLRWGNI